MERTAAQNQQRRNIPIAAPEDAEAPDARSWRDIIAKQNNVPAFMLLDAIRSQKKAQATADQQGPAFAKLQNEYNDLKAVVGRLQHDSLDSRAQLDAALSQIQKADEAIKCFQHSMVKTQGSLALLLSTAEQNGEDVSRLSTRVEELKRQPLVSQAKNEDIAELRANMNAGFGDISDKLDALVSSSSRHTTHEPGATVGEGIHIGSRTQGNKAPPTGSAPKTGQNYSHSRAGKQDPPPPLRPDVPLRTAAPHAAIQLPEQLSYVAHLSSRQPRQARHTTARRPNRPASQTPSRRSRVPLPEQLKQAVTQYAKPSYPRTPDIEFMWDFMDKIEDKELSRQLQAFLLNRFNERLVRKSRAGARLNRFITFGDLTWPLFAQGVGEFLKSRGHQ